MEPRRHRLAAAAMRATVLVTCTSAGAVAGGIITSAKLSDRLRLADLPNLGRSQGRHRQESPAVEELRKRSLALVEHADTALTRWLHGYATEPTAGQVATHPRKPYYQRFGSTAPAPADPRREGPVGPRLVV